MGETTVKALTMADACALADIIRAAQGNKRVKRLIGDDVVTGTVRCVADEHGGFFDRKADVREAYVRVTLTTGLDVYWPIADLIVDCNAYTVFFE